MSAAASVSIPAPTPAPGPGPESRPVLPRGVRLHFDKVRNAPVLLGPEVALMLDPIGEVILREIDGARSIAEISAALAARYAAPEAEITADVSEFLAGLAGRLLVDLR